METFDKKFIDDIVKDVAKQVQKLDHEKRLNQLLGKKSVLFHETYHTAVDMCERIKSHAELNEFPERIFKARAPRMTSDEYNYLKGNYKQVTMPVYVDYISTLQRIFHDANYNLVFEDETKQGDNKTLQEYLETEIPEFGSLENYMKSVVTHLKSTDANGVIAVRPKNLRLGVNDLGETVVDDTMLDEPIPFYFESKQIIRDEPDKYILVLSNEKSLVQYGSDKKSKKGYIFEFYDSKNVWFIKQVGKFEDFKFKAEIFYEHGFDKLPYKKLKGIPSLQDGKLVWVSPFMYAVDLLDLVALNSSYLNVIVSSSVFPYRVMYGDECGYEYKDENGSMSTCDEGYVFDTNLQSKLFCPKCGGTGLRSRVNPFGVMLIRTGNNGGGSDKDIPQTPMAYIEPKVDTPEFLMKLIADYEMKARRILHLNTSSSQVQGGEGQINPAANTATGMMTDLKALYAFVKPISDQIFEIWEFLIDSMGIMRYGSQYKKPILTYPNTFDFYTESDYMNNISVAVKAGMPTFVVQTMLFKYLQSTFYNETKTAKVFNIIYTTDRLITLSSSDISTKQARGKIQDWEAVLHDSSLTLVQMLIDKNPKYLDEKLPSQQTQLIDLAKQKAKEINDEVMAEKEKQSQLDVKNIMRGVGTN